MPFAQNDIGEGHWSIDWSGRVVNIVILRLFTRNHTNGAMTFTVPFVWEEFCNCEPP